MHTVQLALICILCIITRHHMFTNIIEAYLYGMLYTSMHFKCELLSFIYTVLYCIVLYLNTCYSAPTRFPIQRRSRLLRERWIGVSRRSAWAIASEGLAQGPYAAALRWIRTRNPPAARHRTYPYTTAPQYIVMCCIVCCIVLHVYNATEPPAVKIREINLW